MADSFSGESRYMANFSRGKRWGVCPRFVLEKLGADMLPVDCMGVGSGFRSGVAVGVISFHVTKGRVSY